MTDEDKPIRQGWWDRVVMRFASDEACKTIFDHLRNIGLCGLVLGAGIWRSRSSEDLPGLALGLALVIIACWLFLINQANAISKFRKLAPQLTTGWVVFFGQLYSLLAVSIVASVIAKNL